MEMLLRWNLGCCFVIFVVFRLREVSISKDGFLSDDGWFICGVEVDYVEFVCFIDEVWYVWIICSII